MTNKELKKALNEAATWELQATEYEKSKIPYSEAREAVINRIFEKYKNRGSFGTF